jgi:cobalt/nickel transport system permease protein
MMFTILHLRCKNQFNIVMKFTALASSFPLLSSITFVFDYGLRYCLVIMLKTLSGGICLSYLALSTPMDDILYFVSRIKGLRDVCDIAKHMERFLIVIEDEYIIMYNAMKLRAGFDSLTFKIKNTGKLAGLLFVNTMKRWEDIKNGINSRCYTGSMPYLNREFEFSFTRMSFIVFYNIFIGFLVYNFS